MFLKLQNKTCNKLDNRNVTVSEMALSKRYLVKPLLEMVHKELKSITPSSITSHFYVICHNSSDTFDHKRTANVQSHSLLYGCIK